MKLPVLRPGDLVVPVPIIQGAMAGTDAYRLNKITTNCKGIDERISYRSRTGFNVEGFTY